MLIETQDNLLHIQPNEDLLITNAASMQKELITALDTFDGQEVKLDLCQINNVDSTGLKLIIGLYKSCQSSQKRFYIETSSSSIIKLMQICGLSKVIEVKEVLPNG